ncbi:MAG: HNH endonuclease [Blastocatellia bacterium]
MTKRRVSRQLQQLVSERANFCCEYCLSQEAYSPDPFSIEHILPEARGGTNTEDNLARACQGCNNLKYDKTTAIDLITLQEVPLFHPRKDVWSEHFVWNQDLTELVGLTPTGRATVAELKLNRQNVVNLRTVLLIARQHPPAHRSA